MVAGLQTYMNAGIQELADAQGTVEFTKMMNDVYDALNRIDIGKGLAKDNCDYKVKLISNYNSSFEAVAIVKTVRLFE